ncbi:hypothetical protein [Rubritalea tangerina]
MHGYVMSFAQPHQSDNRLWKLWNVVEQNLEQTGRFKVCRSWLA